MGKKDRKQKHSKYNKTEQNTNTKYLGKSTRKQHPDTKAGRWGLEDGQNNKQPLVRLSKSEDKEKSPVRLSNSRNIK